MCEVIFAQSIISQIKYIGIIYIKDREIINERGIITFGLLQDYCDSEG